MIGIAVTGNFIENAFVGVGPINVICNGISDFLWKFCGIGEIVFTVTLVNPRCFGKF